MSALTAFGHGLKVGFSELKLSQSPLKKRGLQPLSEKSQNCRKQPKRTFRYKL